MSRQKAFLYVTTDNGIRVHELGRSKHRWTLVMTVRLRLPTPPGLSSKPSFSTDMDSL